jgi:hypothetical protein
MNDDDPEKRIAELEGQLAEAKAAAAAAAEYGDQPADERGRRYAEGLWEGLRTGAPAGPDGPSGPEIAQLREALSRAATEAGMSPEQLDNALRHGNVTIKTGHSVVYPGQSAPQDFGNEAASARQRPRRKFHGLSLLSTIICASILVGVLTTMVIPSSALWMSGIMCSSPYQLAHQSTYSNGHGDSISFQCVSDADSYRVNEFAIMGLQAVIALPIVGVGVLIWRRLRTNTNR